jgi:hypothetical protein
MFSAVMVARGLVNWWYGRQKKLTHISIGQIWRADTVVLPEIAGTGNSVTTHPS